MATHSTSKVTVDGCKVEVMRGGRGEPLLFLHGAGGAQMWLPFMDKLAERYEVIVPSHPGFDRSDTPDWLDGVSDLAYFYLDFIDKMKLTGVHLVGNSLGGWIAAEIAVRDSAPLKSLTLISAAGIHVNGVPKGDLFLWTPEQRIRNLFHNQSFADRMLQQPPSEEMIDIQLKNSFTTAKLAWSPRFFSRDLHKWLHRIDVPTLIVWGDDDKIFPAPYAKAYQKLIPGSKVEVLGGCGHVPQIEKMDAFIALFAKHANGAKPVRAAATKRPAPAKRAKAKAAPARKAKPAKPARAAKAKAKPARKPARPVRAKAKAQPKRAARRR
jgi:pimeloyl-ACP methyl ester carboxylesterase